MQVAIPFDIYLLLEEKLGKAEALKVGKAIETSLSAINEHAETVVLQKKLEIKEELSKELASKADVVLVKTELRAEIKLLNVKLNFLIILMIIALTLMNPVAADIIRGWIK